MQTCEMSKQTKFMDDHHDSALLGMKISLIELKMD